MTENASPDRTALSAERALRWLLRYIGTASLLALVPVFMPESWMDEIHQDLGMGPLPTEPVVGYLARSVSLFYALQGGLLWVLSFDLPRYRRLIRYVGGAFLVFGVVIFGIDFVEGMPAFWRNLEGPVVIGFGILVLFLVRRVRPAEPS